MAQCPKCDAELSLGAQYCGQCGAATTALQSSETSTPPTPVKGIFTASAYIVQTKISEAYSHRDHRNLRSSYELSTFEIREVNGALVARAEHE